MARFQCEEPSKIGLGEAAALIFFGRERFQGATRQIASGTHTAGEIVRNLHASTLTCRTTAVKPMQLPGSADQLTTPVRIEAGEPIPAWLPDLHTTES